MVQQLWIDWRSKGPRWGALLGVSTLKDGEGCLSLVDTQHETIEPLCSLKDIQHGFVSSFSSLILHSRLQSVVGTLVLSRAFLKMKHQNSLFLTISFKIRKEKSLHELYPFLYAVCSSFSCPCCPLLLHV